jgi:predicted O-methyltransferase YrrM
MRVERQIYQAISRIDASWEKEMSLERWSAVDAYFNERLHQSDTVLDEALQAAKAAGLPQIQVAENQGKMLALLAQSMGARSILEIGTLGGYSTIWLAQWRILHARDFQM